MADAAAVILGSALGGAARYWLSGLVGRSVGETFPWGTMAVNVSGAFTIGVLAAAAAAGPYWLGAGPAWQLGAVGFLGSYTTVSSFSLQTLALARDGQLGRAAGNVAASLGLCLAAAALGLAAGAALTGTAVAGGTPPGTALASPLAPGTAPPGMALASAAAAGSGAGARRT